MTHPLYRSLLAAAVWLGYSFAQAEERPNLLFVITDDMYPWQMDFMPTGDGNNYTPNLDRLASEGIIMQRQYVSSSVCTPSRYSVLTGRYASRSLAPKFLERLEELGQTHVEWNTFINPTKERTVAHYLSEAGYRTGFVGKDHVAYKPDHKALGLSADASDPKIKKAMKRNYAASQEAVSRLGFEYAERIYYNNPDFNGSMELAVHNQDWITEGAVEFIESKDDRPFFLYFATTIPHGPTSPERSWKADRTATPIGWLDEPPSVQPGIKSIAKRATKHGAKGRETVLWIDDAIGALLDALEASGKIDTTIIFFFNDHGQSAKGSVYEGGVRNPSFVWKKGGWPAGPASDALVSNIDFAPTLLDLAGAAKPGSVDGESFAPVLQGKSNEARENAFFEMGFTRGILSGPFKYIALRYPEKIARLTIAERKANLDHMNDNLRKRGRTVHTEDPNAPMGHLVPIPGGHDAEQGAMRQYPHYYEADQLYDLSKDPNEQVNLAADPAYSEKLAEMKELLRAHLAGLPGSFDL